MILDLFLPPRCAACDALGVEPFCAFCALALEPGSTFRVDSTLDSTLEVTAVHGYGGALATALFRLKYDRLEALARPLGRMLCPYVPLDVDVVVPVPLGPSRLRVRGYNPPRELARALPRRVDPLALERPCDGPTQVGASREARKAQVRHAFRVRYPRSLENRRVLLIDDVVTTGATLAACAEVILAAGARTVRALTLARADLNADDQRRRT